MGIGILKQDSISCYQEIIAEFVRSGAEGIILACTEIGRLVQPADSSVPLLGTTHIHAEAAVAYALA